MIKLTLIKKIGLVLFLPFVGALAGVLVFAWHLRGELHITHDLDVAGQQRMLAAELDDWADMVSIGQEEDRAGLRSRVEKFEHFLIALQQSGQVLEGVVDPVSADLRPELAAVASLWNQLRPDLLAVVETPRSEVQFMAAYQRVEDRLPHLEELTQRFVSAFVVWSQHQQRRMLMALAFIAAANFALFLAGLFLIRRYVIRPISAIEGAAKGVRNGDFLQHLDDSAPDEIGTVAHAFNLMVEGVKQRTGDLERSEKELRQSDLLNRSLVEHLPQRIFVKDRNSVYLFANTNYAQDLGIEPKEIVGKDDFAFFPRDLADGYRADDQVVMADGKLKDIVERYKGPGGEQWIHTIKVPYRDAQGEIIGVLGVFEDITARKEAENERVRIEEQLRASQKLESIGSLAGGIAHDFNNLLGIITGYCELSLPDLKEGDPLRGNLQEIQQAGERAAALTRQLLAFSRRQVLAPTVLNLNDVLVRMDRMLHRLIGEDIKLATVPDTELGQVKADPSQMEQVIMNLAVNARDAMPQGGKLTLETKNVVLGRESSDWAPDVLPGQYVMMAVSDTGKGMDAETIAQIFEPFFTTKEKGKGTGLGLSTVHGIVKQSGGHVSVYSEPGHGTSIKVYLPRVDEKAELLVSPEISTASLNGSETVLVVEDEERLRKLVCRILKERGYTVLEASSGGEALRVSESYDGPIPLLLTDVVMPGLSGRETAAQLTSTRSEIKVLYMSGYTDDAIVRHGVLEKGVHFLPKPFTPEELARKVREVLGV